MSVLYHKAQFSFFNVLKFGSILATLQLSISVQSGKAHSLQKLNGLAKFLNVFQSLMGHCERFFFVNDQADFNQVMQVFLESIIRHISLMRDSCGS